MLGLGISTVNVLGLQIIAQNNSTLSSQYYTSVAREAAQAGTKAAADCIRSGATGWSNTLNAPFTPSKGCDGLVVSGKPNTVADNPILSSTFEVRIDAANSTVTTTILTSIGKVMVKGPGGIVVRTYTESVRTKATTAVASTGRVSRNVTQVSTGPSTTCAVADGWVYCWGSNFYGQLGIGQSSPSDRELRPKAAASNTAPTNESIAGVSHSVCVYVFIVCQAWQTIWDRYPDPSQPASALMNINGTRKTVTKVSVGESHTCAVADSKAYCWGNNSSGQLGDRTSDPSFTPVAVDTQATSALAGKTVVDISAGTTFTCALTSEGKTVCWGNNSYGQLGGKLCRTSGQWSKGA